MEETDLKEQAKGLSRRTFLQGAAALGTVAAGGVFLSSCSGGSSTGSKGGSQKQESETTEADPIEAIAKPESWDYETEVLVVGAGGSGLAAAIRAAEFGSSVIAVEKSSSTGGNSIEAAAFGHCGGARVSNAIEAAKPAWPFDVDAAVSWVMSLSEFTMDPHLVKAIIANSGEMLDWLEDMGVEWELDPEGWGPTAMAPKGALDGKNECRAVKSALDLMATMAEELGVDIMLNAPAKGLVEEDGRVIGAVVTTSGGEEVFIHASKGVILSAGGFTQNRDMLKKYCPTIYNYGACATTDASDTGECIRMALGLGAEMVGLDSTNAFDGGINTMDEDGTWTRYLYDGATQLTRQPWLSINKSGQRIPYFDSSMGCPALTAGAAQQMIQPGGAGYVFFDDNYEENAPIFDQGLCRKLITPDMPNIDRLPDVAAKDWREGAKSAIERGAIKKADSLEELAVMMGLDPDIVVKAVDDWNDMCATGEDSMSYMPLKPEWLIPIQTPPFYAAKVGGILFCTKARVAVNPDMQVLKSDGNEIPGLYATVHTAGGSMGSSNMTGFPLYAGDLTGAVVSGYIAGKVISEA